MFKRSIAETPFTTEEANCYFSNIVLSSVDAAYDTTLISSIRALVAPRLEGDELFTVDCLKINPDAVIPHSFDSCGKIANKFCLFLYQNRRTEKSFADMMRIIETDFESVEGLKDFTHNKEITIFFHNAINVVCFTNQNTRNTIVFAEITGLPKFHYLQCALPSMLPWCFSQGDISEEVLELCCSLREATEERYLSVLSKMAARYDFRQSFLIKKLSNYEVDILKDLSKKYDELITSEKNDVSVLNNRIKDSLSLIYKHKISLDGINEKIKTIDKSELVDYFVCNKNIQFININQNHKLHFAASGYLSYWDKDLASRTISNKDSFVYQLYDDDDDDFLLNDPVELEKLLKAIFIDESLKLRICASFTIDLRDGVSPVSYTSSLKKIFPDCMPNPHIDRYNCMGNYIVSANELIMENDHIGVIELCISSTCSLNWADSTVMETFIKNITEDYSQTTCIELPGGRAVSPVVAIALLDEIAA
jgi:hypothetical protein